MLRFTDMLIYDGTDTVTAKQTRRALSRVHVPLTKMFPWRAVNKTILKPHLAAATGTQYLYVGISRCNKILRCIAVQFRHPDYNPVRAQKLISSSMSQHLSTRNILSKSMHTFVSNLAKHRGKTDGRAAPLSEVNIYYL